MGGLLAFGLLLAAGATAALVVYIQQQAQRSRYAQLGAVACGVCDREGVEERGGGSYRCGACGYDTDAEHPPEEAAMIRALQELAIARTCLSSARREFEQSKHRVRTVVRDGKQRQEEVGPFHGSYLEGIEQAEEASAILRGQVGSCPGVGPALACIGAIEPPTDTKRGFNPRADAAAREVTQAAQILAAVRAEMVEALRR